MVALDERLLFLSPERPVALEDEPSPTTDVFLMGEILHSMLMPGPWMDAQTSSDLARALLDNRRATFSRIGDSVSRPLSALVARRLARDPSERQQDVVALLQQVAGIPELGDAVSAREKLGQIVQQVISQSTDSASTVLMR